MKKVLLILSCLLVGCFHKTFNDEQQATPAHESNVVSIARMTTNKVNVICEQKQQDDYGIPVDCNYQNTTDESQWVNTRVSIYNKDGKLVRGYDFQNVNLLAKGTWHVFIKIADVEVENSCGFNLSKCTLLVENVNPWIPDYKP